MHAVFMGVTGSGKTTVATRVAERLALPHAEGDDFHPPANVAKMSAGQPLTDDDRAAWLDALAAWLAKRERQGETTLLSCSALKRGYRDVLRGGAPDVRFIHLTAPRAVIARRLRERPGHFMPPELLDSQRTALEPLRDDERGVTVDVSPPPEEVAERATAIVAAWSAGRTGTATG